MGEEVGVSNRYLIDQPLIDRFADVTQDHQWIHVEVARACARHSLTSRRAKAASACAAAAWSRSRAKSARDLCRVADLLVV